MRAAVEELDIGREAFAGEDGGDGRQQDLAPVTDREDPRVPIQGRAEEVTLAGLGGAGVDGHPDPQRTDGTPGLVAE